jgi:non-ribosomal peptide synthase protein (TIGR01720 family)
VSFEYLGEIDEPPLLGGSFNRVKAGPSRNLLIGPHLLQLSADIVKGQLNLRCRFSAERHSVAVIQHLLELLQQRVHTHIGHCLDPNVGNYTASDFPMAQLSEDQLGAVLQSVEFESKDATQ